MLWSVLEMDRTDLNGFLLILALKLYWLVRTVPGPPMGSGKVHHYDEPHFDIMNGPDRYCQYQDLEVHCVF